MTKPVDNSPHRPIVEEISNKNTPVRFANLDIGECFEHNAKLLWKTSMVGIPNAMQLDNGEPYQFSPEDPVTPAYNVKITYTLTRPE